MNPALVRKNLILSFIGTICFISSGIILAIRGNHEGWWLWPFWAVGAINIPLFFFWCSRVGDR